VNVSAIVMLGPTPKVNILETVKRQIVLVPTSATYQAGRSELVEMSRNPLIEETHSMGKRSFIRMKPV